MPVRKQKPTRNMRGGEAAAVQSADAAPDVVGTGGYGCVLSPAIVFPNSKVVTHANRHEYVTKIARDAYEEFGTTEKIVAALGPSGISLGVFPVDPLEWDLTRTSLGANATGILQKCRDLVDVNRETGHPRFGVLVDPEDESEPVSAIQYPRYWATLEDTSLLKGSFAFTTDDIVIQLVAKLKKLHAVDVVHLDIKAPNLCVMHKPRGISDIDARFADWGLALDLRTETRRNGNILGGIGRCAADVAEMHEYYKALVSGRLNSSSIDFLDKTLKLLGALAVQLITQKRNPNPAMVQRAFECFKLIDWYCLFAVIVHVIGDGTYVNNRWGRELTERINNIFFAKA